VPGRPGRFAGAKGDLLPGIASGSILRVADIRPMGGCGRLLSIETNQIARVDDDCDNFVVRQNSTYLRRTSCSGSSHVPCGFGKRV